MCHKLYRKPGKERVVCCVSLSVVANIAVSGVVKIVVSILCKINAIINVSIGVGVLAETGGSSLLHALLS
jgi:hypothetical protein